METIGVYSEGNIEIINTLIYFILIEATNYRGIKNTKKEKTIQISLPNLENSSEILKNIDTGNMYLDEFSHKGNITMHFTKNKVENLFILKALKLPVK